MGQNGVQEIFFLLTPLTDVGYLRLTLVRGDTDGQRAITGDEPGGNGNPAASLAIGGRDGAADPGSLAGASERGLQDGPDALAALEEKGYLTHKVEGKAHVFRPAVKREAVVKRTVRDFLDRLFGGDPRPLMQFLAREGQIDAQDLEELGKLIDKS